MISKEDLKVALPKHLHSAVSDDLVNKINGAVSDPYMAAQIRENLISFTKVLAEGRFKLEDYFSAVVYVTHKLMGDTNQNAYKKTFPGRYQALVAKGATDKDISAYVAAYNKNKLVNLVLEQTMVPLWVLNQSSAQEAINKLVSLMRTANSEKVQFEAANALVVHLKPPEVSKFQIDLGVVDNSGMAELRQSMAELAQQQLALIAQGVPTQTIAHQSLPKMRDVTPEEATTV